MTNEPTRDAPLAWRKSSYSGNNGGTTDCVEVAFTEVEALVRDSKFPDDGSIRMSPSVYGSLIAWASQLELPA
ncbi:DUF397 domain-containing protein [Amycolatopsis sp. VC5-11]|uniref:DUF397 domain-containing protein n=1 Tax=Amycolatopsis sp. VC5-11 TaxID=3120156 RepID=UPI003009814A